MPMKSSPRPKANPKTAQKKKMVAAVKKNLGDINMAKAKSNYLKMTGRKF